MLIDFEKAFDSLSWEFLHKSLELFNFGEKTMKWVSSLQKNSTPKFFKTGISLKRYILGGMQRRATPSHPICSSYLLNFWQKPSGPIIILKSMADKLNEEISTDYIEMALQNIRKLPIRAYTKYRCTALLHKYSSHSHIGS